MLTSGKITLRDRRDVFDEEASSRLTTIWDEFRSNSVEVAVAFGTCFTLEQFASDHCIYFAGIFMDTDEATSQRAWPEQLIQTSQFGLEGNFSPLNFQSEIMPLPNVVLIGAIYLIPSQFDKEVTLGIALLPQARGNGYAHEAVECILTWAFEECGYHRVQAAIMDGPHRDASLRLFAKSAFAHEGRRSRQVFNHVKLEFRDVTYMGILDTDWTIRRYRRDIPYNAWEELFQRHAREREALLEMDRAQCVLKRSASTETLKMKEGHKVATNKSKRRKTSTAAEATYGMSGPSSSRASLFSDWVKPSLTDDDEGDHSSISSVSLSSSYEFVSVAGVSDRGTSPPVSESAGSVSSRSLGDPEIFDDSRTEAHFF